MHLLFCCLAPLCLVRTDWSEVKCDGNCDSSTRERYDWYFEFTSRLKRITRYSTTANKYEPSSTWMGDSLELKHHSSEWLSPGFLLQSIYTNDFDIYERFQAHECLIHTNWWLSPGLLPWVTSIIWLSNYLFPVQWNTVTALTVAWIVRTINFYTHFSKNTNLETDTSLPII